MKMVSLSEVRALAETAQKFTKRTKGKVRRSVEHTPCPTCGVGVDTDGDGNCAYCGPHTTHAISAAEPVNEYKEFKDLLLAVACAMQDLGYEDVTISASGVVKTTRRTTEEFKL